LTFSSLLSNILDQQNDMMTKNEPSKQGAFYVKGKFQKASHEIFPFFFINQ